MSKQPVERRSPRVDDNRPPADPAQANRESSARGRTRRRYLHPADLQDHPTENLRRLTRSPLLPDRLSFVSPTQL